MLKELSSAISKSQPHEGTFKGGTITVAAVQYYYAGYGKCLHQDVQVTELVFPIAGIFFIPPDRVFGNVKEEVMWLSCVVTHADL